MNTEEKEIQNVTSDSEDQGTSTPVPSSKKKRNIPAIVASVIAFLAIVSSISKPSPDSYQALQEKYNKLKKDYKSQEESLELVTNQYDSYKNQMMKKSTHSSLKQMRFLLKSKLRRMKLRKLRKRPQRLRLKNNKN